MKDNPGRRLPTDEGAPASHEHEFTACIVCGKTATELRAELTEFRAKLARLESECLGLPSAERLGGLRPSVLSFAGNADYTVHDCGADSDSFAMSYTADGIDQWITCRYTDDEGNADFGYVHSDPEVETLDMGEGLASFRTQGKSYELIADRHAPDSYTITLNRIDD